MKSYGVEPGEHVKLKHRDAGDIGDCRDEDEAAEKTELLRQRLDLLQERLYSEGRRAVLIVLQGIDTSGKDGTIRHVMTGVNPQGCVVTSFKTPTPLEKSHDFLWRIGLACPPHGYIGIFNRSQYEDVLITRVHGWITNKEAQRRLQEIRTFETMLTNSGTRILKFFLHLSREEQMKRLLERIDNPEKHWKFSPQDLKERAYWNKYRKAFEEVLSTSSSMEAPWYVVPADHKWYRNLVVADCLVRALEEMDPQPPKVHGLNWKKLRKDLSES